MGLFNSTCCPPRPKRTMDYILNWIDTNSLIISKNTSFINDLIEWRRSIENDLYGHVKDVADEYITNYDWSTVPEFDVLQREISVKAEKVVPIAANTIATWDINGNLQDSEKTLSDFVRKPETFTSGNFVSFDINGNLQDSNKKASDFAPAAHTHSGIEDIAEGFQHAKLYADNMTQGNPSIVIELADEDGRSVTKAATIDLLNTIDNLIRALNDPDTVPTASSDNLITSGAVYNALNNFNVTTIGDDTASVSAGQSSIEIETPSLNIVISDEGQGTEINIDANNAANLDRALKDPDTTPTINSNKLITSGGVKSALNSLSSNLSQDIDEGLATKAATVHTHSIADITNLQQELNNSVIPVGTITMYAGDTAPDGWLLCDGSYIKCVWTNSHVEWGQDQTYVPLARILKNTYYTENYLVYITINGERKYVKGSKSGSATIQVTSLANSMFEADLFNALSTTTPTCVYNQENYTGTLDTTNKPILLPDLEPEHSANFIIKY